MARTQSRADCGCCTTPCARWRLIELSPWPATLRCLSPAHLPSSPRTTVTLSRCPRPLRTKRNRATRREDSERPSAPAREAAENRSCLPSATKNEISSWSGLHKVQKKRTLSRPARSQPSRPARQDVGRWSRGASRGSRQAGRLMTKNALFAPWSASSPCLYVPILEGDADRVRTPTEADRSARVQGERGRYS